MGLTEYNNVFLDALHEPIKPLILKCLTSLEINWYERDLLEYFKKLSTNGSNDILQFLFSIDLVYQIDLSEIQLDENDLAKMYYILLAKLQLKTMKQDLLLEILV